MGVKWPQKITNTALYERAKIPRASKLLRQARLSFLGHVTRSAEYALQPVHMLLKHYPTDLFRQGKAGKKRYQQQVDEDLASIGLTAASAKAKMMNREAWKLLIK